MAFKIESGTFGINKLNYRECNLVEVTFLILQNSLEQHETTL